MSIFEKFFEQASVVRGAANGVAQNAVKQTKTLASVGRTKIAVATEEDKIKKAYAELGRLFYRDYEAQVEVSMEEYQPWCDKITEAKEQIAKLNEEVERLRAEASAPVEADVPAEDGNASVEVEPEFVPEDVSAEADAPIAEESETQEAPAEPTVNTLYVDESAPEE